jgi:anaerobic ribonucleoside-triphosphate reductase
MLETQIGPLTLLEWGLALIGIMVLFSIINLITGKKKTAGADNLSAASCLGCGWEGPVSKYHRTCPRCGNNITRMKQGER